MEDHIERNYNDKWKNFVKRALRNIDFLDENISESIIDDISYKLKIITVNENTTLFNPGMPCDDIHIIVYGMVNIFVNNNDLVNMLLDTLYPG